MSYSATDSPRPTKPNHRLDAVHYETATIEIDVERDEIVRDLPQTD